MYNTTLDQFKVQQRELHRQADHFRLTKSLQVSSRTGTGRTLPLSRLLSQQLHPSKNRNNTAG